MREEEIKLPEVLLLMLVINRYIGGNAQYHADGTVPMQERS